MTNLNNDRRPDQEPLWEFIPAAEYKPPSPPMASRVKGGIAGLWQKLGPTDKKPESPLTKEDELKTLPDRLKQSVVPPLDWRPAATALEKILADDSNGANRQRIAVVSPPYSDGGSILKCFAESRGWREITPPSAERILAGDESWLQPLTDNPSPWILPNLEKCYLRHHRGLALVRRLFVLLQHSHTAPGIVGCGSWAWAYFQHMMPELLPSPVALQSFDSLRLAHWFRELAPPTQDRHIRFRQSDNGDDVLPLPSDTEANSKNADNTSQYLKNLAAYSRGIPGIAWSIWGSALRNLPDNDTESTAASAADSNDPNTIWVLPWKQLNLTAPPADISAEQLLVLHALLLHDGLGIAQLPAVLPFSAAECGQAVTALKKAGLIEQKFDEWRVSAVVYPIVRPLLQDQDYLTDDF